MKSYSNKKPDMQTTLYNMLIVDDDSTIRDNLKDYLLHYHGAPYSLQIDEASTVEDALEKLKQKNYDLVMSDINLPDKDGFYLLEEAVKFNPDIKKALITAYDLDTYIQTAKENNIYNIMIKVAPFNFTELSMVINNLLLPENAFGLEKYIKEPVKPIQNILIQSSEDIIPVQQQLKNFFQEFKLPDIDALSVVIVEAITNAVYHSAKHPDGSLRYKKGEVIEKLPSNETVTVSYGYDNEKIGVSIQDQGGTITPDEVMYWLERNISGNSLMDTHGRGIYLIHRLIDRVVINLDPKRATEIILLHYINEETGDNKPLYINELSKQKEHQ